jgi:hypothetical protein
MAVSRRFLILWLLSACGLVRLYFLVGRDSIPPFSPYLWKPSFSSGDGGAEAPDINLHNDNPSPANQDSGSSLVGEPLPLEAVPAESQDEGSSDGEKDGGKDKGNENGKENGKDNDKDNDKAPAPPAPAASTTHAPESATPEQAGLTISLVETGGSHDEVTSALVYAFASQKDSALTIFSPRLRYGIEKIMDEFHMPTSTNSTDDFKRAVRESAPPEILISTTCELDSVNLAKSFEILLAGKKTYLFCVIHHADRWMDSQNANSVRPWVEQGLVDFVTLSEHTARFFRTEAIDKWDFKADVEVHVLPPVFPVNLPAPLATSDPENKFSLAMQGDYDASRRDYTGIFQDLGDIIGDFGNGREEGEKIAPPEVALHLIGHGNRPPVPDSVKQQTVFDENLSYIDFYTLLSRSFALLPAFASREYFDRKASSTVPASMIGGVPLVASEELLKAYSYLPREAAWISKPDEGEMDVIKRVRNMADERAKKRDIIKVACQRVVKENIEHATGWIKNALKRTKQSI